MVVVGGCGGCDGRLITKAFLSPMHRNLSPALASTLADVVSAAGERADIPPFVFVINEVCLYL